LNGELSRNVEYKRPESVPDGSGERKQRRDPRDYAKGVPISVEHSQ
jgi:hypothetical protein